MGSEMSRKGEKSSCWFLSELVTSPVLLRVCRVFPQNAGAVFRHNFHDHVPSAVEGCCRWPNCNGIKRQSLSLITILMRPTAHPTSCFDKLFGGRKFEGTALPVCPRPFRWRHLLPTPSTPLCIPSRHGMEVQWLRTSR
jgi:hypothetical protein